MSKDMWFDQYEKALNELEDAGVPPKYAEKIAAEKADKRLSDIIANSADYERKRRREEP